MVGNVNFKYWSCWGEPQSGRALPNKLSNSGGTVESCLALAFDQGYIYAGLEYGGECWAGNDYPYGGSVPETYCSMACSGNSAELCGGNWVLTLYVSVALSSISVPSHQSASATWTYQSCWGEPSEGTALAYQLIGSDSTVEQCLDLANNQGFTRAGLENGGECWASTVSPYGGQIPESYCEAPCVANHAQKCGGKRVLSLYVSTAIQRGIVYDDNGGEWHSQGCWGEPAQGRALYQPIDNNANQDVESCLAIGTSQGFVWCGLEYGFQCWCAYNYPYGGSIPSSYCNMPCNGNSGELCGGGNTLSLYQRRL